MKLEYRLLRPGEEGAACCLIKECFDQFIAPGYTEAGISEFFKYANPRSLKERAQKDHFTLVAVHKNKLIGIIEFQSQKHISLLFVKPEYQNMGIAKELLKRAIESCGKANPPPYIDVNASPYSVKIYEKLGFKQTGEEKEINGIRFTPMEMEIK